MSIKYSATTNEFYDTAWFKEGSIPSDAIDIPYDVHTALFEGQSITMEIVPDVNGFPILRERPAPTADQVRSSYEGAAQIMLDSFANSWGYDSIARAVSYVNSKNAKYKAEGQALSDWRDDVWTASEAIDEAVTNGGEPPASEAAFLAMLPDPPARPPV